jgi:hypothetical protein
MAQGSKWYNMRNWYIAAFFGGSGKSSLPITSLYHHPGLCPQLTIVYGAHFLYSLLYNGTHTHTEEEEEREKWVALIPSVLFTILLFFSVQAH